MVVTVAKPVMSAVTNINQYGKYTFLHGNLTARVALIRRAAASIAWLQGETATMAGKPTAPIRR